MSSDGTFKKWRVCCRLAFFVSVNEFVVGPVKKKEREKDLFRTHVVPRCWTFRFFVFNVKCWQAAEGWCVCLCGDVLDENDVVWTLATDKTTGRYVLSTMCSLFSSDVSSQVGLCCCSAKLYLISFRLSFFVYFYGVRLSPHKKGLQGLFETRVVVFVARAG